MKVKLVFEVFEVKPGLMDYWVQKCTLISFFLILRWLFVSHSSLIFLLFFLNIGIPCGVCLSDHLLEPIFQSSITSYNYNFFMFMVTFCEQLSCTASTPVFLTCVYYQVVFLFNLAPVISTIYNSINYFHWKILALAGIWAQDLCGTKPKCYQLSYPGLDSIIIF